MKWVSRIRSMASAVAVPIPQMREHMKTQPALLKVLFPLPSGMLMVLIRLPILRTMETTCLRSLTSWQQREPHAANNRYRPPQHEAIHYSRAWVAQFATLGPSQLLRLVLPLTAERSQYQLLLVAR